MSAAIKKLPTPLVNNPRNQLLESLVGQMEQVQWWAPEKIINNQTSELRKLLRYAMTHSAFYRERFNGLNVDELTLEKFASLPLLTRDDIHRVGREIDCDEAPANHGAQQETMTSGSTGTPVAVRCTALVEAVWAAVTLRDHLWHGRDAGLSNAAIRWRVDNVAMAPEGLELADWGDPFNQFYETGAAHFLNSSSAVSEQVQWLLQRDPHYLISHPSNLKAVLEEMGRQKLRLNRIIEARTVGEALPSGLRELVRETLGVELVDFYSSQEVGYIALQCPQANHYHVQSESLLVEIVDDQGRHCQAGESGRVVVTSLRNYATPLIRYEVGDYAEVGERCACGRGLPVLNRIHGRVRNMMRLADGSTRWPNFGFREMMKVADLRQFQVVQHALDQLELKIVVSQSLDSKQESEIKSILSSYLNLLNFPHEIEISYHQSIERSNSGKYEDFLCLIEPQEA